MTIVVMRVTRGCLILLVPYIPLGIVAVLLRLAIFAHAYLASVLLSSCGALKRFVLRTMCLVLGWTVTVEKAKCSEVEQLPLVSNHVSLFDHLIIHLTSDCFTPHAHVFHWYNSFRKPHSGSINKLLEQQRKDGWLIHLLPEKLVPKDSDSVSHFDAELFESLEKVQPVAVKANRLFPIRLVGHPVNWVWELLWQLFTPFTCYSVTYLKPMTRFAEEDAADFAERVCQTIAHHLNVPINPASDEDKTKHLVTVAGSEDSSTCSSSSVYPATSQDTTTRSSLISEELDFDSTGVRIRGASQCTTGFSNEKDKLKEKEEQVKPSVVFPIVDTSFDHLIPIVSQILSETSKEEIRAALVQSGGDVDMAIDQLVSSPEAKDQECAPPASLPANNSSDSHLVAPSRLKTAAEAFHSSSSARQVSLAKRREALLKHARKRFLITTNQTGADVD